MVRGDRPWPRPWRIVESWGMMKPFSREIDALIFSKDVSLWNIYCQIYMLTVSSFFSFKPAKQSTASMSRHSVHQLSSSLEWEGKAIFHTPNRLLKNITDVSIHWKSLSQSCNCQGLFHWPYPQLSFFLQNLFWQCQIPFLSPFLKLTQRAHKLNFLPWTVF